MWTKLHWVEGPWPGALALAARPRGGDWLKDELSAWRGAGVDVILSLLTPEEEHDLELGTEQSEAQALGLKFLSLPIEDRGVPPSETDVHATLDRVKGLLSTGMNVAIHCRQGVGRTGLMASCLLISAGLYPEAAVTKLSAVRGVPIPETAEQRHWIDHYASIPANSHRSFS